MRELRVGFGSALEFWRKARAASPVRPCPEPDGRTYGQRTLTLSEQVRVALAACAVDGPLEVVCDDAAHRHTHELLADHVWTGPLGADHLLSLGSGVFVCRMPVVLVQLAQSLDEIELAEIALEMTGTYGVAPWTDEGMLGDLLPLVDPAELRGYAMACRALGVRGASRACRALRLVVPNSNSPRESDVAIALGLSRSRGGLMLEGFEMNKAIRLPGALAEQLGQSVVIPDFSWNDRTLVEYDSKFAHDTPESRARDERKRRAYQSFGFDCLTLTNEILRSNQRYEWFADDLQRSLGVTRRPLTPKMGDRRRQLRERLFGIESEDAPFRRWQDGNERRLMQKRRS